MQRKQSEKPGSTLRLALILTLLFTGISVSGLLFYQEQRRDLQQQRNDELSAIADLKVNHIEAWRKERLEDAAFLREGSLGFQVMKRILANHPEPNDRRTVATWMLKYKGRSGYSDLILLDAAGKVRLSTLPQSQPVDPESLGFAAQAIRSQAVILSDLHRNAASAIRMSLCVPVSPMQERTPIGALLIEIDPALSLYSNIENWPTPSKTAETVLLRQEGNQALYLTEVRHRKGTALSFRLPFEKTVIPIVTPGPGAVGKAHDYRGVAVLAATRRIANTPWILVAKIDLEEIYAPLQQKAALTGLAALFLLLASGTGILLWWRGQQSRFYQRQYIADQEKASLTERLAVLSRYASDIILWSDQNGQIKDVNERAAVAYGYDRADLLRLRMIDLLSVESREDFERQWARVGEEYESVMEVEHQRKDATMFPVEICYRLIVLNGELCYQSLVRDISERKRAEDESRLLSSIVESTDDAIIGKTPEGVVVSWNKGAERIYGYCAEEMVGRPVSILVPPQHLDDFPRIMKAFERGQSVEHFETQRLRKDGQYIFVSLTVSALRDRSGQVTGASVIARDISERKLAEAELAKAHRETRAILETISDGFSAFDREWRYTYINAQGATLLGKQPEELLGKNLWVEWPWVESSPFGTAFRRAVVENVQVQIEAFYPEPLNKWYDVRCYPASEGLVLFYTDTTERRQNEQLLRLSEERYRTLALATTQIVWTTDPKGEAVNDMAAWRAFTGQTEAEIKGWGRLRALHSSDRERTAEVWSKALINRSIYDTEYRLLRHDGEYRWMSAHAIPVMDREDIREWIGTCTDITERRQAEEAVHQLNQQLEQRVLERTAQLEESNKELEAFAYSVSHDLRAPLRAVNGFSRILLEDFAPQLPAEARHCVDMTCKNALHMGELIDGLLKFSRLSRQPLSMRSVVPADLVRQAWDDLRAEQKGRLIEFNVGTLPTCQGDTLLLRQVFVNLLSNALKYTRSREVSRIDVGATAAAAGKTPEHTHAPVYFVRDNGVGFDTQYKDKLFGVFQRLHRAEDYEGSGVGLATVQRIVHRHGGHIWADSVLDEGATFYFTLPDRGSQAKGVAIGRSSS